ncbi:hypothetical protein JTE90_014653 [Oedothorax gibbosus]|uniref:Uncharacterized protein n=1 Tax=Oedothorax gibbosus TaxID=931172 RepID=A0AAV6V8Q8_9ARAC|nr:hypothetical protein JTE90_014653 [Oedothorax gibbosus]
MMTRFDCGSGQHHRHIIAALIDYWVAISIRDCYVISIIHAKDGWSAGWQRRIGRPHESSSKLPADNVPRIVSAVQSRSIDTRVMMAVNASEYMSRVVDRVVCK